MRLLALALVAALLFGCTNEEAASSTLDKAGYTDVRLTGWQPLSCAESDLSSTGFVATNAKGKQVEGVVCCGLTKFCTVRF